MSTAKEARKLAAGAALRYVLGGAAGALGAIGAVAVLLLAWIALAAGGAQTAGACGSPESSDAPPVGDLRVRLELHGPASTYGDDPSIGWHDAMDAGMPPASGIPNSKPGIAVYNPATLRGWWIMRAPGGATAILQQTDIGPNPNATTAIVDINAVALRTIFGVRASAFQTKVGTWTVSYVGKRKPLGAGQRASGGQLLGDEPAASDGAAAAAACSDSNQALGASGPLGQRIASIAARYEGKSGRSEPFADFQPPTFQDSWCAWFVTNVWKLAGVQIEVDGASFAPYTWAAQHHTLFKAVGQAPRGRTPPLGSALMYGSGPESTSTSQHVNLVSKVNRDGSYMILGGNQGAYPGHVTGQGPCRLSRADPATQNGPGCDPRPIYGIAVPR